MAMQIDAQGTPIAGQAFRFTVTGVTGRTTIEVYIADERVRRVECPDPPCHDIVQIPRRAGGMLLRLSAIDAAGHRREREFSIADPGTSTGGSREGTKDPLLVH